MFIVLALAAAPGAPAYASSASGAVSMGFDLTAQPAGQETDLWIPYPVSDENQTISNVRIEGNFKEAAVYTDKKFQTPMLHASWPKDAASRKLSFTFDVAREEVVRRDFPATEAAWDPADYAVYLEPTALGPIDGEVKKLADKITAGKTGVLAKARAVYDWMCENSYRNPDTRGCGEGDVCVLIKDPGGKCGDLSSLYVALARAAGVPCREIFGIRQGKKDAEDITGWQHCWVEFFLPGYGWVPIDPADVRKMMLTQKLTLDDPKTKEYRDYYWGGLDPYRIRLSEGRDLTLAPPQTGAPVNYLMYPFAQVGGKTLDWLDPKTFSYSISYSLH